MYIDIGKVPGNHCIYSLPTLVSGKVLAAPKRTLWMALYPSAFTKARAWFSSAVPRFPRWTSPTSQGAKGADRPLQQPTKLLTPASQPSSAAPGSRKSQPQKPQSSPPEGSLALDSTPTDLDSRAPLALNPAGNMTFATRIKCRRRFWPGSDHPDLSQKNPRNI